jgi:hypothetical protein
MKKQTARGVAAAAAALGLVLAGCGSDTKTDSGTSAEETTTSEAETSAAGPSAPPGAEGQIYSIVDYIKDNQITEAPVRKGDPGAPTVTLPELPGWKDAGPSTPQWAYSQIVFADPAAGPTPPTITAIMSRLTGADPAKIIEFAPGELQNLPGYQTAGDVKLGKLSGFDAVQVGGTYLQDGQKLMVAQKTVIIPAQDELFVLQLNAEGTQEQIVPLSEATAALDRETTIAP